MAVNATDPAQTALGEVEYPYQTAVLTACYLVAALQIGYYGFYILFMGTDAVFKASRAFDYEDFDCQRKSTSTGSELDSVNNANSFGRVGQDAATSTATVTSTECNSNFGGSSAKDAVVKEDKEIGDGDGGCSSSNSSHRRAARPGGSGGARGNLRLAVRGRPAARGPLYRLMQSCSCMLVYKSDDEDEDDEDDFKDENNYDVDSDEYNIYDEVCVEDENSGICAEDRADGDATGTFADGTPAIGIAASRPTSIKRQQGQQQQEDHRQQLPQHHRKGDSRMSACAKRHPSNRPSSHQSQRRAPKKR